MTQVYDNTNSRAGKHLTYEERIKIEGYKELGYSNRAIARILKSREHFGHWEIDTLLGARAKDDPVLLTLVERKTRFEIMLKINQQDRENVDQAMNHLDRKSTRLNSSHVAISYAVFCLKKKKSTYQ